MTPMVFVFGALLFLLCLAIHVVCWRMMPSKVSSLVLFIIFLVVPGIFFVAAAFVEWASPDVALQLAGVFLLHLSLSLVYISSYPAAKASSPSLEIIFYIASSERGKMTEEEIARKFTEARLVKARVDDLMMYGLIAGREGCFELTGLARAIILCFIWYRRLLGLPAGEG